VVTEGRGVVRGQRRGRRVDLKKNCTSRKTASPLADVQTETGTIRLGDDGDKRFNGRHVTSLGPILKGRTPTKPGQRLRATH
jgi:hypothetical protein